MSGVKKKINHQAVFRRRTKNDDNDELSYTIIISARQTGKLNLSSKGLSTVPNRVWTINELTPDELKELHFEFNYEHKEERWWEQEPLHTLELSCNSLTEIDAKIKYLSELAVLNLNSNLLEYLPSEIGALSKLRELNLSYNKLEKIPSKFYNLSELRVLNMRNNNLKQLDPAIGDLIMLTHMNLSYNSLTKLPIGMGYLVRLISLDLSHNMLKELPPDIMSMRALQKLDTSFNQLETLPSLSELRKVELLMFHTNSLKTFPDLCGCVSLKELHLADNKITEINMSCLEGIGQIRKLILANNKIQVIPEEVVQLINLEIFDLSYNDISLIPSCIGIMPNLKQFIIDGNSIQNIRTDIIRCGTHRILKHIRQSTNNIDINISGSSSPSHNSNISIFPDKYTMRNTKLLSLTGQNLIELTEEVIEDAKEARITLIDLSRNKFSEIPEKLSEVNTVTDLKLTSNRITVLPEWIGEKYTHLQILDLSKNSLKSLPSSIALLKNLRDIDISFNRYTELPESIYNVDSLQTLIANDNSIINIDVLSLVNLKRLVYLNLANNNIQYVPPELGNLTNIRTLLLSGNCFKQPRQAILMKSTDEILEYLRSRILTKESDILYN